MPGTGCFLLTEIDQVYGMDRIQIYIVWDTITYPSNVDVSSPFKVMVWMTIYITHTKLMVWLIHVIILVKPGWISTGLCHQLSLFVIEDNVTFNIKFFTNS